MKAIYIQGVFKNIQGLKGKIQGLSRISHFFKAHESHVLPRKKFRERRPTKYLVI